MTIMILKIKQNDGGNITTTILKIELKGRWKYDHHDFSNIAVAFSIWTPNLKAQCMTHWRSHPRQVKRLLLRSRGQLQPTGFWFNDVQTVSLHPVKLNFLCPTDFASRVAHMYSFIARHRFIVSFCVDKQTARLAICFYPDPFVAGAIP